MRKKLALVLAATLAFSAFAVGCGSDEKETTTTKAAATKAPAKTTEATTEKKDDVKAEEIDCTGWWAAHSSAKEVTADGFELTFKSKTYDTATANWNTPVYVVYTADEAFAGGAGIKNTAGYAEYFVMRSDNYGWAGDFNTAGAADLEAKKGITVVSEGVPADDAAWATWLEGNKAGVDCKLSAKLDGENAVVTLENNGIKTTATIKVEAGKTIYVSVSGELCKITDLK